MQFQSTVVRRFWTTAVAGSALDAVLSAIIAGLFSDDFWFPFVTIFAFLTLWPLAYGVRTASYSLLLNWFNRRSSIEELKREFRQNEMPNREGHLPDADYYFQSVINDTDATEKAKVYSAAMLGQLSVLPRYSPVDTMRTHSRLEQALKEFTDGRL